MMHNIIVILSTHSISLSLLHYALYKLALSFFIIINLLSWLWIFVLGACRWCLHNRDISQWLPCSYHSSAIMSSKTDNTSTLCFPLEMNLVAVKDILTGFDTENANFLVNVVLNWLNMLLGLFFIPCEPLFGWDIFLIQ